MPSCHILDTVEARFDDDHAVANAGLLLPATLAYFSDRGPSSTAVGAATHGGVETPAPRPMNATDEQETARHSRAVSLFR